jgi:type II secretory pathway component GspD/PulD (secretin)
MNQTPPLVRPALMLAALFGALSGSLAAPAVAQGADPETPPVLLDWGDEPARRPQQPRRPDARPAAQPGDQPAAQPVGQPAGQPVAPGADEPTIDFGIFSEPVQLTTLIDFVGETLGLNIVVKGQPAGEIVFNAPVSVPQSRLLDLLDAMLEQYGFTITSEDQTGFYIVQPISDVRPSVGGARSSVRIIATPNIKPSQLATPLSAVLGEGGSASIQPVDELGVIIVTAPSRDIARVEAMVNELMRLDAMQRFIRIELDYIAAPTALERAVALAGSPGQTQGSGIAAQLQQLRNRGGEQPGASTASAGSSYSNLSERITVDPQGNALIFRGTEREIDRVRAIVAQIDVPNTLEPKSYFAGSSATQIAEMAKIRGLGEVVQVAEDTGGFANEFNFQIQRGLQQQFGEESNPAKGGPVMVVDAQRGNIIYYGTPEQHRQLDNLMKELRTDDERIVIREYVLNHSDAETVAELITSLVTGERQTGDAPLLPSARGVARTTGGQIIRQFAQPGDGGDEVSAAFDPDVVVVLADPENNQVVVKAPLKQHDELAKLIDRLDRRRAQVYIQAQIVAVTDNEDFTLAFESQYLRGEFGIGTNFGLSRIGEDGSFTDPREVVPNLGGLTAAIIRSDYVPLIINASQTDTDVRIISSPQVLVNDNEEASIVSIEQQPFSTTNFGNDVDTTSFGGYEDAGTQLTVTPSISEGGFIRLEYEIELSNFISATGLGEGLPPPRNTRTVTGKSTIPTDSTIVIGGLTVEDVRDTVIKVPFIGDIPLVGQLFRRTNKVNNKAKVYVFLTPRIMTDPNFNDLKLLTQGPQADMAVDLDAPELEPVRIPGARGRPAGVPELEPVDVN